MTSVSNEVQEDLKDKNTCFFIYLFNFAISMLVRINFHFSL